MAFSAETFARQCQDCKYLVAYLCQELEMSTFLKADSAIVTHLMPFFCLIEHQLTTLSPEAYVQWLQKFPLLYKEYEGLSELLADQTEFHLDSCATKSEAEWLARRGVTMHALLSLFYPLVEGKESRQFVLDDGHINISLLLQTIDRHEVICLMTNEILEQFVSYIPTVLEYCAKLQLQV